MLPPVCRQPAALQLYRWTTRPYDFLHHNVARHGDAFTANLATFGQAVFLSDPDEIAAVWSADPDVLEAGKGNDILEPFVGPNSVLVLDGTRHRRARRLLMGPFHGQRSRAWGPLIVAATRSALATVRPGDPVRIQEIAQRVSLDIILRIVFGIDPERLGDARDVVTEAMGAAGPLVVFFQFLQADWGPGTPGRRLQRSRERVDQMLYSHIAARRAAGGDGGDDVLGMLLAARDEDGKPMPDDELRDELWTLLIAGHETTATAITWAMHHLVSHPEIVARLAEERKDAGDDANAVARLPLLAAACNESLRLTPILPIVMRVARTEVQIGRWTLPAGMRVAPCMALVHHRADLFPDPDRFDPDRFVGRTYGPTHFFPFGGGNRRCLGAAFAELEMRLVVSTLLERAWAPRSPVIATVRRNLALGPADGTTLVAA